MNTDTISLLDKHFDLAINAPDGIKRLREMILALAMQGKLVPQDPKDHPASELLKEIEAEKKRLVKEGKIKEPKPLSPVKPEEVPYEVPEGWEWFMLGEIIDVLDSQRKPVTKSDRKKGIIPYYGASGIVDYVDDYIFNEKLVLIGEDGAKWGKGDKTAFIINGKTWVNNHAHVIRPNRNLTIDEYLVNVLIGYDLSQYITGMTVPKLNQARLVSIPIPLPPLAEQRRIVAKIDELMARAEELERRRDARNEKRLAMHQAAIARLLDAGDANASRSGRDFIFAHFGELYRTKENVAELRKAVLQLAVMGRLVPHDPQDKPASELLKEIEAEKKRLVQEGKIKEPKPLPPIKPEEVPYQVPKGWEWVRLGDIGNTQTGTTPATKDPDNYGDFIPFVGPGDIQNSKINNSNTSLSKKGLDYARLISKNSILMVCIGGSIGKHAVNSIDLTCNQQINTVTPYLISVVYLFYSMGASFFQNAVIDNAGGSATPIINKQKWSLIPLPLPPLAEQDRIVAKVDELMMLCDKLDKQIDERTAKESALLEAVAARV